MAFDRHPLSAAFPDMPADDFNALVVDIEEHGLRDSAWLFEGKILDGWHRYKACLESGATFRYEHYKGTDPIGFVLSRNMHRRHLTASQRAMAVVACHEWQKRGANQHFKGGSALSANPQLNAAEMAKEAQVSTRTIAQAKVAHEAGLGDAVQEGALSVREAEAIATGKVDAPKPAREDPKAKRIAELEAEVQSLRDALDDVRHGAEEAVRRAETAKELLDTDPAKALLAARQEIDRLERLRDSLQNENGALVRQVKALQRKLDKIAA